jgi:hypothetical protein
MVPRIFHAFHEGMLNFKLVIGKEDRIKAEVVDGDSPDTLFFISRSITLCNCHNIHCHVIMCSVFQTDCLAVMVE